MASETKWATETPIVDGIYWYRWGEQVTLYEIALGKIWGFLSAEAQDPPRSGAQWLGPISPSDIEQLNALRCVVFQMQKIIERRGVQVAICTTCDPPNVHQIPKGQTIEDPYICATCQIRVTKRLARQELYGQGPRRMQHGESLQEEQKP